MDGKVVDKVRIGLFRVFLLVCLAVFPRQVQAQSVAISVSNAQPSPGETIQVTVTTTVTGADHAYLGLIPVTKSEDPAQVCIWPGAYQDLAYMVPLGQPFSVQAPPAGKYYLLANIGNAADSPLCAGAFSWSAQSCNFSYPECQNGSVVLTVGYDMTRYWNLKPGNYWIFSGTNLQLNQQSRTRWDVENRTRACGRADLTGYPVLMTKQNTYGYWQPPYSTEQVQDASRFYAKNLRFFLSTTPVIHAPYMVDYVSDPNAWYQLGTLPLASAIGSENGYGYYQAPPFLSDLAPYIGDSAAVGSRPYFIFGQQNNQSTFCGNLPSSEATDKFFATETISYATVNVTTPAYSGSALTLKQGEQGGPYWAVREDWTFARDIGLVRLQAKNYTVDASKALAYPNNASLCTDGNHQCRCLNLLAPQSGEDVDCGIGNLLQRPFYDQKLVKYYLGGALRMGLGVTGTTVTVHGGNVIRLTATDPVTGYAYEGFLETNAPFVNAAGTLTTGKIDSWFGENGTAELPVGISVAPGTYTAAFRPWIRRDPGALTNGSEQIVENANLPWSNTVTLIVAAPTGVPVAGDLSGDGHLTIEDIRLFVSRQLADIYLYTSIVRSYGQ